MRDLNLFRILSTIDVRGIIYSFYNEEHIFI